MSDADPAVSSEEPWFVLSKEKYQTILNRALLEMEEPEVPAQAVDLTNCSELVKLLNQDDGLGSEPRAEGVGPTRSGDTVCKSSGSGCVPGNRVNTMGTGRRQPTWWKTPSGGFQGKQFQTKSKNCFPGVVSAKIRTKNGDCHKAQTHANQAGAGCGLRKAVQDSIADFRRTTPAQNVPASQLTNTVRSFRPNPKPPLLIINRDFVSQCRLVGQGQARELDAVGFENLTIPKLDLKPPKFFQRSEADELVAWPCSNLAFRNFDAARSVAVKTEDGGGSENGVPMPHLERLDTIGLGHVTSESACELQRRADDNSLSFASLVSASFAEFAAMTSRENMMTAENSVGKSRYVNKPATRVQPYPSSTAINDRLEVSGRPKSWCDHRDVSLGLDPTFSNFGRHALPDILDINQPINLVPAKRSGKTSTMIATSPRNLALPQSTAKYDESKSQIDVLEEDDVTWGNIPLDRRHQLWAAVDKEVVNTMMEQILDEESTESSRQSIDPDKNSASSESGAIFVEDACSDVTQLRSERYARERTRGDDVTMTRADDGACALGIADYVAAGHRLQHCFRDNVVDASRRNTIWQPAVEFATRRSDARSASVYVTDGVRVNERKLGMSRMSFKWKSNILLRLRKDQISSKKWRLSETLLA